MAADNISHENIIEKIHMWLNQKEEVRILEKKVQQVFEEEIIEKRVILQEMANFNSLKRTTFLSSQSLHEKWNKYLNTPVTQQNKKTRKIERSILLYLTRMIAKTSPFSSLTLIGHAKISQDTSEWNLDGLSWKSDININNMVSIYLWELITNSPLSIYLPLETSPYLRVIDGNPKKIEFIKIDRRRATSKFLSQTEQRVKIPYNEQVYSLYKYLKLNKGISIKKLVGNLSENNDKEKTKQFIQMLLNIKLINFETPYNEQDTNYLEKIRKLLSDINHQNLESNEVYKQLCLCITELQSLISKSTNYNLETIFTNIQLQFEKLTKLFDDIVQTTEKIEPMIYEDCYIKQELNIPKSTLDVFSEDIQYLQPLYVLFDPQIPFKIFIIQKFKELYRKDESVNILHFQQTIQGIITKSGDDILSYIIEEISDSVVYKDWLRIRKEFFSQINSYISQRKEEVLIDKDFLYSLSKEIPKEIKSMQPKSWSYFIQPLNDGEFVINKISDGNGKFMSRFMQGLLQHVGPDIAKNTKEFIKKSNIENNIIAELNGVFGFNANVHPYITDYEIDYPGVKSEKNNKIGLDDIFVRISNEDNGIELYSKSYNKKIDILYLQFLNLKLVPPLFRFLLYFSQLCNPDISINESYFNISNSSNKGIVHFPRIKVGKITLKRRQWWINKNYFFEENTQENDHLKKFRMLRQWLHKNSIPNQFYLKANLSLQLSNQNETTHYQDGMRKPQYIDTDSFHLCQVFFNQINIMEKGFIIEEALPNVDQVQLNVNGQRHMVELLLETYETEV